MRVKDMLLSEETLFKNPEVFNPDYVPDQFDFRDSQMKELASALKPAMKRGRPVSTYILGRPATGKTTAAKIVFDDVREATNKILPVHINCQLHASPYKIMAEIHRAALGYSPPDTGVPITKIHEKVFRTLSDRDQSLVVALDDVNYLFVNNHINEILYTLLRAHETYGPVRTAVWCISTKNDLHKLEDKVRSIYQPTLLEFAPYARKEMHEILKRRVDYGLYSKVMSEDLLDHIVDNADDIRHGIELIKQSVIEAENDASKKMKKTHVERAIEKLVVKKKKIDEREKRLLDIIKDKKSVESGRLYEILKKDVDVSYTTFYRMLSKLESLNMIETKEIGKEKGRTRLISAR